MMSGTACACGHLVLEHNLTWQRDGTRTADCTHCDCEFEREGPTLDPAPPQLRLVPPLDESTGGAR